MIKKSILFVCAVCLWAAAIAQDEAPVILASSQGKITYQSPSSKGKQKLVNGAVLQRGGAVKLTKKSSAVLLSNGHFRQIAGKKTFSLGEQFAAADDGMVRLNFEYAFSNYIGSAVVMAASPESAGDGWGEIKTSKGVGDGWGVIRTSSGVGDGWGGVRTSSGVGDGWGSIRTSSGVGDGWGVIRTSSGTGDGWGGRGNQIRAIMPFGKILPSTTTLYWSKPAGNRSYKLSVMGGDNQVLFETTTQDTFFTLDPAQHNMAAGQTYQWRVAAVGEPAMTSNTLSFDLSAADERAAAVARAERATLYQQSPESLRGLMRAVSFERDEWFGAAAEAYREVQKADPKNELARLMHAAFWVRYGLREVASQAYKK
jgi:hypothetical protein